MIISTALIFGFLAFAPLPDLTFAGSKKVDLQVSIENPQESEHWQVMVAEHWGPARLIRVEPNVPFSLSTKYGTTLYAIPVGTPIPQAEGHASGAPPEYKSFPSAVPPVTESSVVSDSSPIAKSLTTFRILSISDAGFKFQLVSNERFDSEGKRIGWLRLWTLELGVACAGLAGLILLYRRRLKRAAG